jgi:hypothetical protein
MSQTDQSILFHPAAIATLANSHALYDLQLFLKSLMVCSGTAAPTIFLLCSSDIAEKVKTNTIGYTGIIHTRITLDLYKDFTREQMESRQSRQGLSNLFHDFTQEKCGLMEWALKSLTEEERPRGVLFCDADIFWLGELPLLPWGPKLALSQHMIRKSDETLFGEYNAGFLWTNDLTMPSVWKAACRTSRFFEQAALEDLADALPEDKLYLFPIQFNYGWWRVYQNDKTPIEQISEWSFLKRPVDDHAGILVQGQPLRCIHTHFKTKGETTQLFNIHIQQSLEKLCAKNIKAANLLKLLTS